MPLDFTRAVIVPGETPGDLLLTVSGNKPSDSAQGSAVKLQPASYTVQPEYWKIELLWDNTEAIFTSITPFTTSIPLGGIRGTQGIEVVGKSRSKKISI